MTLTMNPTRKSPLRGDPNPRGSITRPRMHATHRKLVILIRTLIYDGLWGRIRDLPLDMWMAHRRSKYARINTKTLGEETLLLS